MVAAALCGAAHARASAQSRLDERYAEPFLCRADFDLRGYEPLLAELRGLQRDVIAALQIAPASAPIDLRLFRDKTGYRDFMQQHFPDVPHRRALYVKSGRDGSVYAYRNRELDVDLRHEATHALLHEALPVVPLWLDEGLAEYFEMPAAGRASQHPYLSRVRRNVQFGFVPRIQRLETKRELSEMGDGEYRDAWAWVHFMLEGPPEARAVLIHYLDDIRRGMPPGDLSARLDARLGDATALLVEHFRSWR